MAHILLVFIPIWLFWVQVVNLAIRFQFGRDAVYSEALFYMVAITLVACLNMDLRKVVHYMQIMHREETDFPCNEFDTYKVSEAGSERAKRRRRRLLVCC